MGFSVFRNRFKPLFLCIIAAWLVSACAQEEHKPALDSKGRPYNSENLLKDWKAKVKGRDYPEDNDAEYVYPRYKYVPVRPQPQGNNPNYQFESHGGRKIQNNQPYPYYPYYDYNKYGYPEDNDAGAIGKYPKYDPEVDNGDGFYPIMFN